MVDLARKTPSTI
jgi:hypothetical protein